MVIAFDRGHSGQNEGGDPPSLGVCPCSRSSSSLQKASRLSNFSDDNLFAMGETSRSRALSLPGLQDVQAEAVGRLTKCLQEIKLLCGEGRGGEEKHPADSQGPCQKKKGKGDSALQLFVFVPGAAALL